MKRLMVAMLVSAVIGTSALAEFTMPTPEQIQATATNPVYIAELIQGATSTQAVEVLAQAVEAVVALQLPQIDQTVRIAIMTAIVFRTFPADAIHMAELIVPLVPVNALPAMAAAASLVMGTAAPPVTAAFAENLGRADAVAVRNAGNHPETILPADLILTLGVSVSHASLPGGREPTALPLAPPIRPIGTGTSTNPPPPGPRYGGQ